MDNALAEFVLVVVTILIGLVLLSLVSSYSTYQASNYVALSEAQQIAYNLKINIVTLEDGHTLIIPYSYSSYNGSLYLSVFQAPAYLINSSNLLNPTLPDTNYEPIYNSTTGNPIQYIQLTGKIYSLSNQQLPSPISVIKDNNFTPVYVNTPPNGYIDIIWAIVEVNGIYYMVNTEVIA